MKKNKKLEKFNLEDVVILYDIFKKYKFSKCFLDLVLPKMFNLSKTTFYRYKAKKLPK